MHGNIKQISQDLLPGLLDYMAKGLKDDTDEGVLNELAFHKRSIIKHPCLFVEDSNSAKAAGSVQTLQAIKDWAQSKALHLDVVLTGGLGYLSGQPVIGIQLPGRNRLFFGPVQDYQVSHLMEAVMKHFVPEENLLGQWDVGGQIEWEGVPYLHDHPFFAGQERRVLRLNGIIDPCDVMDYIAWGGYNAFVKSIRFYTHEEIVQLVEASSVRGRSGSGYPAADKWQKVISTTARKRYVICNADESDPGAYMHRVLLEGNPHVAIEGLMLAAYAIGASEGIIYTRSRYSNVVDRLECAVDQVRELGLIGQDILGSGFSFDIKIRKGPGAYVCGEETALIASLEGKRGMPRPKPPYPAKSGLFGMPTLVHNVETLSQIPLIVDKGPQWYKSVGTEESSGTKLFSLAGRFNKHGVVEVPFGYILKDLTDLNAQGVKNCKKAKAILAGGPSGKFISSKNFDIALDFEDFEKSNLILGSGSLVLLDESSCSVNLISHLMKFIQKESCGKCIPCREGTRRMAEILDKVIRRPERDKEHDTLHR
ncbi:MAG: NADH-quinone oxidoreductase subunit F, partial [Bacteroidetes bacterium]|nr:NADH-quinone oxidoreductase subunit F [Bacteroidota bacterium]